MAVPRASFAEAYVAPLAEEGNLSVDEGPKAAESHETEPTSETKSFAFTTPGSGVARRARNGRPGSKSGGKSQPPRTSPSPVGMEWSPLANLLSEEVAARLHFGATPVKSAAQEAEAKGSTPASVESLRFAAGIAGAAGPFVFGAASAGDDKAARARRGNTGAPAAAWPAHPTRAPSKTAKTAEKLRREGNAAFGQRRWSEAQAVYSQAVDLILSEPGDPSLQPVVASLLANRAATWLSLGQPHNAVKDCHLGLKQHPNNVRCGVRLATCHLRLGDFPAAFAALLDLQCPPFEVPDPSIEAKRAEILTCCQQLSSILRSLAQPREIPADVLEAFFGLPPAELGSSDEVDSDKALQAAVDGLQASVPHSRVLLACRAACQLRLGRAGEAGRLARQAVVGFGKEVEEPGAEEWRAWLLAEAAHASGELEEAVSCLDDLERLLGANREAGRDAEVEAHDSNSGPSPSTERALLRAVLGWSSAPAAVAAPLRESLQLKREGNELVGARRYEDAAAAYSRALRLELPARGAAVLFCNRAAAWLGARQLALAVADAARAACLAPGYAKAHSRLAAALEAVRRPEQAAEALERALRCAGLGEAERREYRDRLGALKRARHALRGRAPAPDHYALLGLERGCSNDALLHSVRVAAALPREGAAGPGALPPETGAALSEAATWLFKCLGEASDTLCDAALRRELDAELFPTPAYHAFGGDDDLRWRPERYGSFGPSFGSTWNAQPWDFYEDTHRQRRERSWNGVFGRR
ncbi:hypothetical protein QBZ16_002325 [Prototheca wickerhamii]|uniref:Uncharacterized protein n=1 Tax=Prototheca wickerhamii TaxID=3111 RepID=A0AAD9IMA2_PROWI|nr:hypothetical protein QBZ16_002325 [Prototheca wickerhamii]